MEFIIKSIVYLIIKYKLGATYLYDNKMYNKLVYICICTFLEINLPAHNWFSVIFLKETGLAFDKHLYS